ncbi:plasmid mobilization protein [Murdochiella vaginalis]|uniref:plasmid mobilization protein n=1 Tax=Murdochiella vaginalis TaxID=1852373 RepID=UPI0008FE8A05|nr:plasmid mobilization relaxosome protein MobC [Murdochiella vaginalis]
MVNRLRNERIEIKLTKEEKNLFWQKMKLARFRNMSLFIRKCVLEKEIQLVDLEPFRKLEGRLANIASNVNQVAKKANATDEIDPKDIRKMQEQIDDMGKEILKIHALLLNRTTSKQEKTTDGHHENPSH